MKSFYNTCILFILSIITNQAQESLSAKLLDSISQKPIPFATIALNETSGVISNETGKFQLYFRKKTKLTDSIFIRCLGYQNKRLLLKNLKDSIIFLNPKTIELNEVMVSNKNYTVEEIIEKTKENIENNYEFSFTKSKLFYRSSFFSNILKSDIKIKKTTIPEFNQRFIDSVLKVIPKNADNYTEILANIYGKTGDKDLQKLDIIKSSKLYDKSKEVSFKSFEEKFNKIIKKHIKRDSYFKIKSGFFGTKEEIDSSFFETYSNDETDKTKAFLDAQKKKEEKRKKNFLNYRKNSIHNIRHNSFIFENSKLNFLEKHNRYNFKIEDYSFINDYFVYKISFFPKRNADYKGFIYINTNDFAIVRVDYENVKPLKTFNLLGISYNYYLKKGTLIYTKNATNKYTLKYADVKEGNKFGIKRPLKIIEKNKHTRGRRKQNELSSDIHFIISSTIKNELIVFENESITKANFDNFIEKPKVEPIYLPKYDPEFWKGYNVIEPNQAIKDFKSIE
ncbi:hypothetical protein A8C32_15405 [Flavivirga aquatica]|uniref:Carboxypeptidase-like regulatory domain-containing protein n=1 Tax=Flavivirga aquatica TaxID=1849968 RepID=A0A1E5T946_9FLAO|nr:carboxypeptidase-like regulatory domain-containing protein [Flavivirga aquatica]OEK07866.1 hypothetical protein A8C32_15405 [Flavivirga aquatica]